MDHGDPSIHFRHTNMSFKIACSLQNPLTEAHGCSSNTHAGVTCLLTCPSFPRHSPGNSKLNRGVPRCLCLPYHWNFTHGAVTLWFIGRWSRHTAWCQSLKWPVPHDCCHRPTYSCQVMPYISCHHRRNFI